MNERIKLPAQEWLGYDPEKGDIHGYTFEQMREFAELIVRECMSTILKESKWYWDKNEFEGSNAIQNAARRVKEHFGVE